MFSSGKLARLSPDALAVVVFSTVFGGFFITVCGFYLQAVGHQEAAVRRHVQDQALLAAARVDVASHERLTQSEQEGSAEYHRALAPLLQLHRGHPHIQYLWTVRVAPNDQQTFVLETSVDPIIKQVQESLGRSQDIIPFLTPNSAETVFGASSIPRLRAGEAVVFPVPYVDDHGTYIEARAPLNDASGRFVGYLGLDYGLDSFKAQVNEVRFAGFGAMLLALVLALVLARFAHQTRAASGTLRREIAVQRDQAERASAAKSDLLRIAAHDLKNPLAAIVGLSGLMLKLLKQRQGPEKPKPQDMETLESIQASAQHMADLVRGILSNEGLESGSLEFRPRETDLVPIVRAVMQFNTATAERKNIRMTADLPERLVINGNPGLLREACDNYLSNALKYTPIGGEVAVRLSRDQSGLACVAVQDSGPGLSAADQAGLFEKFRKLTPRPTGGESSTGLGLSIVKTIVERHGGRVGCDTAPGQGARFWLQLPFSPPRAN